MALLQVESVGTAKTNPDVVWALLEDVAAYPRWGPWDATGYERPGDDAPHGVGAVRWLRLGRTTTVERILAVEPGRWQAYTVVRGIPVRNYRAEVTLTPTADGTHIRWAATWDATILGRIVRRKLRQVYPDIVARLIAAAEQPIRTP
jgi:Polyketide cyclase / dehydrase and lipid transport